MIHPSYKELIAKINEDVEPGEEPIVSSRYSIVMATAKRARQIIAKNQNLPVDEQVKKPLSEAVAELYDGRMKILPDLPEEEQNQEISLDMSSVSYDVNYGDEGENSDDDSDGETEESEDEDEKESAEDGEPEGYEGSPDDDSEDDM